MLTEVPLPPKKDTYMQAGGMVLLGGSKYEGKPNLGWAPVGLKCVRRP